MEKKLTNNKFDDTSFGGERDGGEKRQSGTYSFELPSIFTLQTYDEKRVEKEIR